MFYSLAYLEHIFFVFYSTFSWNHANTRIERIEAYYCSSALVFRDLRISLEKSCIKLSKNEYFVYFRYKVFICVEDIVSVNKGFLVRNRWVNFSFYFSSSLPLLVLETYVFLFSILRFLTYLRLFERTWCISLYFGECFLRNNLLIIVKFSCFRIFT